MAKLNTTNQMVREFARVLDQHDAAGKEIYRLATLHKLDHEELARRECRYSGIINGKPILVSVFDRDPVADLAALRSAIDAAELAP